MDAVAPGPAGSEERRGLAAGLAAYGLWGLFPLYFHLLSPVSALEIVCQRIVWSLLAISAFLLWRGDRSWPGVLRSGARVTGRLTVAALLIAANWLTYVWAVNAGRVVDASLGYFICPLLTVVLGVVVLKERLRPLQWVAAALGAAAVVVLAVAYGHPPWIALVLATSFSAYGFLKKHIELPAARSLAGETLLLSPVALVVLVVLAASGRSGLTAGDPTLSVLLAGTGVVTAVPLVLFAAAARRIPLTMLGLLQYLTPSLQFGIGVVVLREPMATGQWTGFALVWCALALLSLDAVRAGRVIYPRSSSPRNDTVRAQAAAASFSSDPLRSPVRPSESSTGTPTSAKK